MPSDAAFGRVRVVVTATPSDAAFGRVRVVVTAAPSESVKGLGLRDKKAEPESV